MDKDCIWCRIYKRERDEARQALANSLTQEEHALVKKLRREIRKMQAAAERRNRDLAALHLVWCSGGCEGGVHYYDGLGPEAVNQEIVDAAVRNTERLVTWWKNRQYRLKQDAGKGTGG